MTRLYLIDDHAMMRDGLRAMLEAAGHQVVGEAVELTLALAEISQLQPELVLLDLNLGVRSGFELLAELQRRDSPARVVVLTMSDQPRHVAEALRLGAWGYVLKGSPSAELLATITAVVGGRRHLGAGATGSAKPGSSRLGQRAAFATRTADPGDGGARRVEQRHRRSAAPLGQDGRHLPQPLDGQARFGRRAGDGALGDPRRLDRPGRGLTRLLTPAAFSRILSAALMRTVGNS